MSDAIDLDRHAYGDPGAAITVIEYGDFECPYCGAAKPVLRKLVDGSDGRVRLVFRHFPVFTVHPYALTAALAAEAAGDRFWPMHDLLFKHQARLTDPDLMAYATEAGVPEPESVVGEAAQAFRPAVERDYTTGVADGVRGTPTLFVDGRLYTGRVDLGALRSTLGLGR
ncbi:thioredoxin domain-containing protein [Asanoa sp. WMMD1127]|uniref:DsbA family protein n=1 Tax=Asanoa sp. WMMD1127 TaxID=3016107 RepID=UPI0024168C27|nr:thioredoxin domain-containing protein [Asanoa sp. WMMD1127]MDG4826360.1 thioredoxin domain-containing protein [Asanoa sp. WMMD1127]